MANMFKTKLIISILFVSVRIIYSANVTDKSGTAGFAFLKISQGARACAMGECYTGLSNDVNAMYWNPAGISQINGSELTASYTLWLESINKCNIGYVHPKFSFGTLGLNINYVSVPIEKRTVETDDTYDSISVYNMAINFVWAKKFTSKLSLGVGMKYIIENLDAQQLNGIVIDLAGLYKIDDSFTAGVSLQNLGTQIGVLDVKDYDPLPLLLRAGVAKKLMDNRLTVLSDVNMGLVDMTTSISIGSEYKIGQIFYLRFGYKYRITNNNLELWTGISGGFGLKYKRYAFDYAFVPYGDLGRTHRLDFLIRF